VIFAERTRPPAWLRVASLALAVVGVALVVCAIAALVSHVGLSTAVVLAVAGALTLCLGLATFDAAITLDVDEKGLVCGFGRLWRATVDADQIQSWQTVHLSAGRLGGIGLRWLPRTRALLDTSGPGLSVTTSAGLTLLIQSNRADEACEAIRRCVRGDAT
jgi:hypothetical protein